MNKLKYPLLAFLCVLLIGVGVGLDTWFKPHRDVKTAPVFDEFDVDDFTTEFIDNAQAAKNKYLADDGNSKIVTMSGTIVEITTNMLNETVITIRGKKEAGARFTLMEDQQEKAYSLKPGDKIKITGVVSAGAEFDPDLNRYLDAVLEQAYF